MKKFEIIRPADRRAWLAQREKGIGSSEVGTILGVNPFETPYQLWRRKKGLSAPTEETDAMRAGHLLEGAVSTWFEEETGRKVIKASEGDWLAVDKEKDFLRVSPDRTYWLEGKKSQDNKGILECKTTQMEISGTDVPQHWFCQLMYQLGVMGYRQGSLAWLVRGRKFGWMDVAFDANFYGYMVERLEKFWRDCIVDGHEPSVLTVDDVLLKYPRATEGRVVEVTDEVMGYLTELKGVRAQIDELTRQKKDCEAKIKLFMGDAELLCLQGTKETSPQVVATWKTSKDGMKFDEKLFAKSEPALYEDYKRVVAGSRRFLVR